MTATPGSAELLALENHKDAQAFCAAAFGPFVQDISQYVEIVAELMQHATDRALAAKPAEEVREALVKIAEWADLKDAKHPENASGEEVEYGDGYSAGLRAAGKFARAALSTPGQPKP